MKGRLTPQVFELHGLPDAGECLARLARGGVSREHLVALDSAAEEPRRFSWIGFEPGALCDGEVALGIDGARSAMSRLEMTPIAGLPGPFQGGFMGAFAYDLGVRGEAPVQALPEPFGFPLVVGGIYGDFLVRREVDGKGWLVLSEGWPAERASIRERRARIARALQTPAPPPRIVAGAARRVTSPAEHQARIERAREWIAQGEFYQANLAHRFACQAHGDPIDLYRQLRRANPAPYMGYLEWTGPFGAQQALCSSSPELLLEVDGQVALTRPIKGTIAREQDPLADRLAREHLLDSSKDRAELAMIVDLERNDLGRLAQPGGVTVGPFPTLATYAHVHHLLADVRARLPVGVSALDVLAAVFPGGSITGAPKLRAMQAIAELEGHGRGLFCGTLGFASRPVGRSEQAAFNILIRTMLWHSQARAARVSFQVGGGITWSSDARREDEETLSKAQGLLRALDAVQSSGN